MKLADDKLGMFFFFCFFFFIFPKSGVDILCDSSPKTCQAILAVMDLEGFLNCSWGQKVSAPGFGSEGPRLESP